MTDSRPEGFQPAPWEAGKKNTQGPQASPPGYVPPPAPPPQPPRQSIPLGGGPAPAAFGGGDMGRGRTRQIPGQPEQPPAYGSPPPAGYPQGQGYPAPQGGPGVPPQGYAPAPGGPYPQQPYGDQPYPMGKPTTVFGIVALVLAGVGAIMGLISIGVFSAPFFIIGGILGYLGIRETAPWGKKSGRGLAMGGTIANGALLVLNVIGVVAFFWLASTAVDSLETEMNAHLDGGKIVERVMKYKQAKGDLLPGGPQMKQGFENPTAVTGPQLTVPDLVTPTELMNPIEQYSLEISGETATVWWTSPQGQRQQVGTFGGAANFDDFEWEEIPPPPRRRTP